MKHYKPEDVKAHITLSRYLEDQGLQVRGGRCAATWRGGKNKNVSVDDAKGLWYDHKQGDGGDIFKLCEAVEGLDFPTALRTLAERYGINPTDGYVPNHKPKPKPAPSWVTVAMLAKQAEAGGAIESGGVATEEEVDLARQAVDLMNETNATLDAAIGELIRLNKDEFERYGHRIDGDACDGCHTYGRVIDDINGCGSFLATVNAGRETIRDAVSRNAAEIVKRIIDANRKRANGKGGASIAAPKLQEIANVVTVMWLRSRGKFFWNSQTQQHADSLFFDDKLGRLSQIESDTFQSWIATMTDIARSGQQYKTLRSMIQDAAMCPDVSSGVVPSKYYDRRGDAIYISNGDSMMVRVTAGSVETVRNGTDNVVFLTGATLPKWTLCDGPGEDPFSNAEVFTGASYLTEGGPMIIRLWYLCLFAKMQKRPPLLITGPFRSGKTKLFGCINAMLANRSEANAEVTDTPTGKMDFWTAIHAGGLYCIDNADTDVSWLADTLERVSTGSALPKRKLYKDDQLVCLFPNADVVVTSNNPTFAENAGLSDRFMIVRLYKNPGRTSRDADLDADVTARRDSALTWTARTLQKALGTPPDADAGGRINGRHPDFATFALRCAEALGKRSEAESALVSAEFDKALITLQKSSVSCKILEHLRAARGLWNGKASDLARSIWTDIQPDDAAAIRDCGKKVGRALKDFAEQFHACFKWRTTNTSGVTTYHFEGMDKRLERMRIDQELVF